MAGNIAGITEFRFHRRQYVEGQPTFGRGHIDCMCTREMRIAGGHPIDFGLKVQLGYMSPSSDVFLLNISGVYISFYVGLRE